MAARKKGRNVRDYLNAAIHAARKAGAIQKDRFRDLFPVDFKGEKNLVTEVDRASEDAIIDALRSAFPECGILAEESGFVSGGSPLRWIIDPLDGTTNYAHGFPWFAVSIALEVDGAIGAGVVLNPMMDELFTAIRGEGAWLNGRKLSVSARHPLSECLLATGFPYDRTRTNENNFGNFIKFQLAARAVRRFGAAALDLAYVAAGYLDGYWECKLNPWDTAAGKLLVAEAGGIVTDHAGGPHGTEEHRILASNGLIHREMIAVLASSDQAPPP
ncbi:MAG: inositol monophosphatase [Geobacteraceae bacterium]|nr:inositol monophosphatase [Geobacteraceae bacterium]